MDACSAASTIMPVIASRSSVPVKRQPIVCRAASAYRFQTLHVVRFSATAATTDAPSLAIHSSRTFSARRSFAGSTATASRAHSVASRPSSRLARVRQSWARSASGRTCLSGRVASVACCRSRMIVSRDGACPCVCSYSAISLSFSMSMCRDRDENSATSSSGTVATAHTGLRSAPRSRRCHPTPSARVR